MKKSRAVRLVLFNMYDLNFEEKGRFKIHIRKFLLYPKFWNDPINGISLPLNWNNVKFEPNSKAGIPLRKGIYCFVVKPSFLNMFETRYLFYVGKTNRTLQERFGEYLYEQEGKGKPRPKLYEMLNLYKNHLHFYYTEINDEKDVDGCEQKLLNSFVPHVNTSIPKARVKPELRYIYE